MLIVAKGKDYAGLALSATLFVNFLSYNASLLVELNESRDLVQLVKTFSDTLRNPSRVASGWPTKPMLKETYKDKVDHSMNLGGNVLLVMIFKYKNYILGRQRMLDGDDTNVAAEVAGQEL